jgi:hypothetical protein
MAETNELVYKVIIDNLIFMFYISDKRLNASKTDFLHIDIMVTE